MTSLIISKAWFIASEVCKLLEIKNTSDAVSGLDDDEKSTIVLTDSGNLNPITSGLRIDNDS